MKRSMDPISILSDDEHTFIAEANVHRSQEVFLPGQMHQENSFIHIKVVEENGNMTKY